MEKVGQFVCLRTGLLALPRSKFSTGGIIAFVVVIAESLPFER
jgi:hypothetical protein